MAAKRQKRGTRALTKQLEREVARQASAGVTQARIAEQVGCSQATVARVLAKAGPITRRRRTDPRASPRTATRKPRVAIDPAELEAQALAGAEAGDDSWFETTLAKLQAALDDALEAGNHQATAVLTKLVVDLRQRRAALAPPVAPDPNLDPANVAARDALRERLRAMVELAKRRRAIEAQPEHPVSVEQEVA